MQEKDRRYQLSGTGVAGSTSPSGGTGMFGFTMTGSPLETSPVSRGMLEMQSGPRPSPPNPNAPVGPLKTLDQSPASGPFGWQPEIHAPAISNSTITTSEGPFGFPPLVGEESGASDAQTAMEGPFGLPQEPESGPFGWQANVSQHIGSTKQPC